MLNFLDIGNTRIKAHLMAREAIDPDRPSAVLGQKCTVSNTNTNRVS